MLLSTFSRLNGKIPQARRGPESNGLILTKKVFSKHIKEIASSSSFQNLPRGRIGSQEMLTLRS
jgi:hypothetical protein